jgi:hypothetical protein
MRILKRAWLLIGLVLLIAQPAFAEWQTVRKGQYVYWQQGQTFAFPVGTNWFYYTSKAADGSWDPSHSLSCIRDRPDPDFRLLDRMEKLRCGQSQSLGR